MKSYTVFCFDMLFGDHFAKISNQAKLYYVALNFYADRGFVPNPMCVLDSLGYDKSVFYELVKNEEILTLEDRCEVFITSYYVHNKAFKCTEWLKSPFSIYWKGKLFIKKNGVATFNPQGISQEQKEILSEIEAPEEQNKRKKLTDEEWDNLMNELDNVDNQKEPF